MAQAQDIIHFRPLAMRRKLQAYANRHNLSLSDAIRQLCSIGLGDSPESAASERANVEVNRIIQHAIGKVLPDTLKRIEQEIKKGFKTAS